MKSVMIVLCGSLLAFSVSSYALGNSNGDNGNKSPAKIMKKMQSGGKSSRGNESGPNNPGSPSNGDGGSANNPPSDEPPPAPPADEPPAS